MTPARVSLCTRRAQRSMPTHSQHYTSPSTYTSTSIASAKLCGTPSGHLSMSWWFDKLPGIPQEAGCLLAEPMAGGEPWWAPGRAPSAGPWRSSTAPAAELSRSTSGCRDAALPLREGCSLLVALLRPSSSQGTGRFLHLGASYFFSP